MLQFRVAALLLIAEFLNVEQAVEGVPQFKRCYNTSEEETHCFDVQYNTTTNQLLITSFQNALKRCNDMNSTLVIIKNEEIDNLVQQFMKDNNPIGNQYFWLNAYQVNNYDNPDRWHWVNSTLPNLPRSAVSFTYDSSWYTAVLEFRTDNGEQQFYLTSKQPQSVFYYVCEYSVWTNYCSSAVSNDVRLMNGICYRVVKNLVSWYEARNRCNGGDLASFANVTSINFTSRLGSDPNVGFWIGLRFLWYTWGDQGQEVKYTNWDANGAGWDSPCAIFCFNCNPTFTWSSRSCTDNMYVVCHTITPLAATTTSVVKTSPSAAIATSDMTMLTTESQQVWSSSSRAADGSCPSQGSLGIGLGVGLGLPLVISIILNVFFGVKSKRLETRLEQNTRNNITELGAVQEQSVEQVNESTSDNNYQQLNRNLDNSSGTLTYDKLRVAPETQYEDFSPT